MGAIDRIKRDWETGLQHARWAGVFAQAKISEHPKVLKKLLSGKPERSGMSGEAIGAAMQAWMARSK